MAKARSHPDDEPLLIRLAGGYPHRQLDRLLAQLEPVLTLDKPRILHLDLSGLVFMCPTAQAIMAAAYHRAIQLNLNVIPGSRVRVPQSGQVLHYLQRMDVLEPIVGPLPEEFVRRQPSGFRPLQHFVDDVTCYRTARELKSAIAEACGLEDSDLGVSALWVCLGELTENVLFHADSPHGGFAGAQAFRKRPEVEVAIVDTGVGIRESLSKNPAYADIATDVEAIEKALEPMVTATPDRNTGLGLTLTRYLLQHNGGDLMVRSGNGVLYAGAVEGIGETDAPFPGTIVSLRARTDAPLDINTAYDDLRNAGYRPNDDA